uniref:Uncharacterized protein n=1 Tax=Romanomermis culicivorax TaxID=13658 RepID=A0A915HQI2_ROMCU
MLIFYLIFIFLASCQANFIGNQDSNHEIHRCFNGAKSCEMGVPAWRLGRDNICELFFACPTTDHLDQLFLTKSDCEQTCLRVTADVMQTVVKLRNDNFV